MKRDQSATILGILLFSIAIMLSGNAFAADTTPRRVTQPEFDAAIANLQAEIDKLSAKKKVGDHFGGGIVFYVDPTGQHGLIAALEDQSDDIDWYNGVNKVTGATGDGVGAGISNTAIIVAAQSNDTPGGNFAAKLAADYSAREDGSPCTESISETCYGDWYLPSKRELYQLYLERDVVGGFANAYWSSTEYDEDEAWYQDFNNGGQSIASKYGNPGMRAIRSF